MTITNELIHEGRSKHGGWSKKQLALIGVSWPPRKGWRRKAAGRPILPQAAAEFLELRDAHKEQSSANDSLNREFDRIFR